MCGPIVLTVISLLWLTNCPYYFLLCLFINCHKLVWLGIFWVVIEIWRTTEVFWRLWQVVRCGPLKKSPPLLALFLLTGLWTNDRCVFCKFSWVLLPSHNLKYLIVKLWIYGENTQKIVKKNELTHQAWILDLHLVVGYNPPRKGEQRRNCNFSEDWRFLCGKYCEQKSQTSCFCRDGFLGAGGSWFPVFLRSETKISQVQVGYRLIRKWTISIPG